MKKIILLTQLIFLLTFSSTAQKAFPELSGKTLTDKKITIPGNTKGKFTLIGMAYSKKAEENLNTWFNPMYTTFLQKSTNSLFPTTDYDVNLYFVPMITGIAQGASGKIEDKMKKNIDKELLPYVLLYEGEVKTYKDNLNMTEKDEPYFFVLDPDGKVLYNTAGAYSEKKMDQILEIIEESEKF